MDKALWLQKQVRDNSEDLQKEFLDMKAWEEQMKKKDLEIRSSKDEQDIPPVRKKKKKKVTSKNESKDEKQNTDKRIPSYDYRAWDKFDVDKACEEVDDDNTTKINRTKDNTTKETVPENSSKELSREYQEALKLKEEGNKLVQKRKYANAVQKYNEAIKIYPHDAAFYANRALCQLKLDNVFSVISDCTAAIKLDSKYVKAFHRRALAYMELKRYKDALKDIETILKLDISNKEASCLLLQLQKLVDKSEKSMVISGDEKKENNSTQKNIVEKKICTDEEKKSESKPSSSATEDISIKVEHKHPSQAEEFIQNEIVKQKNASLEKSKEQNPESINDLIPSWMPKLKDHIEIVERFEEISRKMNQNLIRVSIKEVPANESIFKDVEVTKEKVDEQPAQEKNIINEQKVIKNENKVNNIVHEEKVEVLPPAPKTSVAFIMTWRKNKSLDFRHKYIKQIEPKLLPDIFKDSMESNIFSEILSVLKLKCTSNNDKVHDYLYYLTKVKRFRALILFLTKEDKEALELLFEYCKSKEGKTDEDVQNLRSSYEM